MQLAQRIDAFVALGSYLRQAALGQPSDAPAERLVQALVLAQQQNPWFSPENLRRALSAWADLLQPATLHQWLAAYPSIDTRTPRTVGTILAGNLPMVGFHDMLSVLVAGHNLVAKLSSKDQVLMTAVAQTLLHIEPRFAQRLQLTEGLLKGFDAVIATGSDNSNRYFDFYFKKYPHLIRGNRHSVAILRGDEQPEELALLGTDIFSYFGLGCRNVSKLYLPQGFDLGRLFEAFAPWQHLAQHNKYQNNFDYHRAIYLMNRIEHQANGFVILRPEASLASSIAVVHYEFYTDLKRTHAALAMQQHQLQCVVAKRDMYPHAVAFGQAQSPQLWDYADQVDTLAFLQQLP